MLAESFGTVTRSTAIPCSTFQPSLAANRVRSCGRALLQARTDGQHSVSPASCNLFNSGGIQLSSAGPRARTQPWSRWSA